MKRKVRLTESDLRGIIKKSVSRILKESDGIDDEGLSNSLVDFINNPVDVHKKDVDYNPSDDEINDAINQFNPDDFDLDFTNLDLDDEDEDFYDDNSLDIYDSRKIRGNRLSEGKLRSIVNKSVNKVLREFGSDGPDWEDIDAGDLPNYPGSIGGYSDHVISANDFDDIDVDSLENYDDDDDINYDEIEMYDDLNLESKKRLGKIVRESINKVLKEGKRTNNKPYFNNYDGSSKAGKEDHVYQYNNKDKSSSAIKKHNDRAKGHRIDSGIGPSDKGRDKLAARERQVNKNKNASTRYIDHPDTIQGKLVDKQHGDEIKNIMSKY